MRRLLAAVLAAALLTGCGAPRTIDTPPAPTEPTLPPETEPTLPPRDLPHLTDAVGIFADADADALEARLAQICEAQQLEAVVIVSDMPVEDPALAASSAFIERYGAAASGFVIRLDESGGQDAFVPMGACMTQTIDCEMALAKATPYLAMGDYPAGLGILLDATSALDGSVPYEPETETETLPDPPMPEDEADIADELSENDE